MKRALTAGLALVAAAALGLTACNSNGSGVVVTNLPPDAAFTVTPTNPSRNEDVTFDASGSTDPDGDIVEYGWSFNGDTINEVTGMDTVVTHSYTTPGERTVRLELMDDAGNSASTTRTLTVRDNYAPVAGFTFAPASPVVDETVTFDAGSTQDSDGTVVEYRWDFDGDGTYDEITAMTTTAHSFTAAGEYGVVLQAVDDDGAVGRTTRTVSVGSG